MANYILHPGDREFEKEILNLDIRYEFAIINKGANGGEIN
jgi:hypothetical protein